MIINQIKDKQTEFPAQNSASTAVQIERSQLPPSQTIDPISWVKEIINNLVDKVVSRSQKKQQETMASILQLLNYQYGNSNDEFHNDITKMVKNIRLVEGAFPEEQIVAMIRDQKTKWTAYTVLQNLLNFKEEFPHLFEKRKYGGAVHFIQEFCKERGVEFSFSTFSETIVDESYTIIRSPKEFKGDLLVLGCGRKLTGCAGHDENRTLLVDMDAESDPDIVANYYSHEFWNEIPDNIFKEVFFEGFCPSPCKSSFKEICRTMQEGGKARIVFDTAFEIAEEEGKEHLENYFKECGFARIEIANETFRSGGHESEYEMLIAYK